MKIANNPLMAEVLAEHYGCPIGRRTTGRSGCESTATPL
jgi:hypothetical protein